MKTQCTDWQFTGLTVKATQPPRILYQEIFTPSKNKARMRVFQRWTVRKKFWIWAWYPTYTISTLESLRQEDAKLKTNLVYSVGPCLQRRNRQKLKGFNSLLSPCEKTCLETPFGAKQNKTRRKHACTHTKEEQTCRVTSTLGNIFIILQIFFKDRHLRLGGSGNSST